MLCCAFGLSLAAVIWQIGVNDGSDKEFLYRYNAWEYGSAPQLRTDAHFNPKTHVWRHVIKENRLYPNALIPECLAPIFEAEFMHPDEVICGVELVWNESAPGLRKLTVDCRTYANWLGIADDGIEIVAAGRRKVWALPCTRDAQNPKISFDLTFPVTAGENRVLINDISKAKHYKIWFDALTLESVEKDNPPPAFLVPRVTAFSGIVHPGETATLEVKAFNLKEGLVEWCVKDLGGAVCGQGWTELKDGVAQASLPTDTRGWFEVESRMKGLKPTKTTYVVTEPVEVKNIPESRFGCHAIESDSYRLHVDNPFRDWLFETMVRRASLAGSRWTRLHSISWALREPKKGDYILDDLDRKFARVEKYKMNILLTTGQTPAWTSTSTNTQMTCCGTLAYLYYPPKNWQAWGDFMKEVVHRYGSRISHYEIGNEPGYTSAFWTCGDAAAFGKYLKTAYEAIKSVKPDAIVYPGAPLNVDFIDEATRTNGGMPAYDVLSVHYLGNFKRKAEMPMRWKGLLRKYGKEEIFVNSEDMSWSGYGKAHGEKAGAAALVRSHVRDAATGVIRTFSFCGFMDLSDSYSFFTVRDEPKPFFAAYRAMTHRLEYGDYVGSLSGAEYEAYVFDRKGTPVTVVWREEPGEVKLDFGAKQVRVVDMMDAEETVTSTDGVYTLKAGFAPIYIEGGDLGFLKDQIDARAKIPEQVQMRPGECRTLTWRKDALELIAPEDAVNGFYDRTFMATVRGRKIAYPVLMEVVVPGSGVNRVQNGDFEKGLMYWFSPKDGSVEAVAGEGYQGSMCAKVVGGCHFGLASRVKVRYGEKYLVSCRARGEGMLGACLSKTDADNKSLGDRPGINLLYAHVTPEWRRYNEIVSCSEPGIAHLGLAFLPNLGDAARKNTLFIDDLVIARLTESVTVEKALNEGFFAATVDGERPMAVSESDQVVLVTAKTSWKGKADLSAECRVALNDEALTLRFDVTDDVNVPPVADNHYMSYESDSIQFAIDPFDDGRDFTSFMLGRDAKGRDFLFKSANYTTPELPENITRNGDITKAQITRIERSGGYTVTVRIPLNEVYPLKGDQVQFGFGWIVNDNDGDGRKYMEWASGIGRGNSAARFGVLKKKK